VERHVGLSRARGHVDKDPALSAKDSADHAVDRDFLVVAKRLAGNGKTRC
jgi:hypothetical protein